VFAVNDIGEEMWFSLAAIGEKRAFDPPRKRGGSNVCKGGDSRRLYECRKLPAIARACAARRLSQDFLSFLAAGASTDANHS
jgi:hypothetical protein